MKTLLFLAASCSALLAQNVTIGPAVFSGAGLNDATSGGQWTSAAANAFYVVSICTAATPDTAKVSKNGAAFSSCQAILGGAQALGDGVTITFAATTGHTVGNTWTIQANANGTATATSYMQRGFGAIFRNLQDKLRESISVLDFGAKGDGATDDTAAIQAAINAASLAGGKTVHVPFGALGRYKTGAITMARNVPIECDSAGVTFLPNANSITLFNFVGVSYSGIARCFFDGTGTTGTTAIATSQDLSANVSANLRFRDLAMFRVGTCMTTSNTYFSEVDNSRCVFPTVGGWDFGINSNGFKADLIGTLSDTVLKPCLQAHSIFSFTLLSSTFEAACETIFYGNNGLIVHGNYWENTSGTAESNHLQLGIGNPYTSSGVSITGNTFRGGASYAVEIHQSNGVEITGNDIATDSGAFILINNGTEAKHGLNFGNNTYNIAGAGYDPTKILFYNIVPTNSLNSNTNQDVVNPLLFTAPNLFTEPQDATLANNQGALYFDGTALMLKSKDGSGNIAHTAVSPIAGNIHVFGSATEATRQIRLYIPSLNSSFPSYLNVSGNYTNPGGVGAAQVIYDAFGPASGGGYQSAQIWNTYTGASKTGTMKLDAGGGITINGAMSASSFSVGATPGLNSTATLRNAAGTGTCTLIFTAGMLTSSTC